MCVTMEMVQDALDQLRGAVMIVYPMGLPPYDPIRMEFENKEDLAGTQVGRGFPSSSPLPSLQPCRFDHLLPMQQSLGCRGGAALALPGRQ